MQIIYVTVRPGRHGRCAKAAQVVSQHPMTAAQTLDLWFPHAAVETEAMQQNDRRTAASVLKAEPAAGDVNEAHVGTAALNIGRM
jgi:hypothetical protein